MKLPRRTFLHLAAGAVALPAVPRFACAQAYPTRPVRLLVGFAPGGPNDIVARLVGERLSAIWGKPVVIDNVTGATATWQPIASQSQPLTAIRCSWPPRHKLSSISASTKR